jgi:hypothetical protein
MYDAFWQVGSQFHTTQFSVNGGKCYKLDCGKNGRLTLIVDHCATKLLIRWRKS